MTVLRLITLAMLRAVTAITVVALGVPALKAQPTPARCDAARAALLAQTTDAELVEDLPRCPNGIAAIRIAILASRQVAELAVLKVAYGLSGTTSDDGLVNAALDVASDAAATELARTFALYAAGGQVHPTSQLPQPDGPLPVTVDRPCLMNGFSSAPARLGAPITAATLARVHSTTLSIFRNATLPPRVRRMALCANTALRPIFIPPVLAGDVQLTYLCGNRFRLRNRSFRDVDVRWEVYNTADRGEESIGAATPLISNFDQTFTTELRGTVRLFFNGALIQTKANGGTVCTTP
jgi:hypothetical protein